MTAPVTPTVRKSSPAGSQAIVVKATNTRATKLLTGVKLKIKAVTRHDFFVVVATSTLQAIVVLVARGCVAIHPLLRAPCVALTGWQREGAGVRGGRHVRYELLAILVIRVKGFEREYSPIECQSEES